MESAGNAIDPALARRGVPNHGLGRTIKVGKEEIVGLLTASSASSSRDEEDECARLAEVSASIAAGLDGLAAARLYSSSRAGLWPVVRIEIRAGAGLSAIEVARQLEAGQPPVYLATGDAAAGRLGIDPFGLQPSEPEVVVARLRQALS